VEVANSNSGHRWKCKRNCSLESMSIDCGKFQRKPKIQTLLHNLKLLSFWFKRNYHNKVFLTHGEMGIRQKCQIHTQHNGHFVINENAKSKSYHTYLHKHVRNNKLVIISLIMKINALIRLVIYEWVMNNLLRPTVWD
jgi:hypothetical protein